MWGPGGLGARGQGRTADAGATSESTSGNCARCDVLTERSPRGRGGSGVSWRIAVLVVSRVGLPEAPWTGAHHGLKIHSQDAHFLHQQSFLTQGSSPHLLSKRTHVV